MPPTVYIETSVIGYLTARLPPDPFVAGQMELTRKWWRERRQAFSLFISDFVINECSRGDPSPARERLDAIADIPLLTTSDAALELSKLLLRRLALPA
jgi:hypothetical protein